MRNRVEQHDAGKKGVYTGEVSVPSLPPESGECAWQPIRCLGYERLTRAMNCLWCFGTIPKAEREKARHPYPWCSSPLNKRMIVRAEHDDKTSHSQRTRAPGKFDQAFPGTVIGMFEFVSVKDRVGTEDPRTRPELLECNATARRS